MHKLRDVATPVVDLPHNDEAEAALLASIVVSNELLPQIEAAVQAGDLFRVSHQAIYASMCRLRACGSRIDLVTLTEELSRSGELQQAGGKNRLGRLLDGAYKSANVGEYIRIVKEKSWRRKIMRDAETLQRAAGNSLGTMDLLALLTDLGRSLPDIASSWKASTLEGVANPEAAKVPYLVDGLLPAGDTTVIGATWKSGKTLMAYRLALDVITGCPAFGRFQVREPLPTAVFQLEMPSWEDDRRLRRLSIGCGIRPEDIPRYAAERHLTFFNRPPLNLTTAEGCLSFQRAVRSCGAQFVVLDSLIAAFFGGDLNDNSAVRGLFTRAFGPLNADGITVVGLHHHRKRQDKSKSEDDRSALLGAQAFGAAAGRVYKLDRLGKEEDPESKRGNFKIRLTLTGSWTPEDSEDLLLWVQDTSDGGTSITVFDEAEQLRHGGMTAYQKAGIAMANLVSAERGIERKVALERIAEGQRVSDSTAKRGLSYAQEKSWIRVDHSWGRKNNEAVLMPGSNSRERP
ncbi:MAG TPA: AAA family ATPase [Acidimicrobiia bacterium]|nr:AAA family ATPase [Acidimicrobiia bacterium]